MKICCVINSLAAGGAEKVMTRLAGGLAVRGHSVNLVTLSPGIPDFYSSPAGVNRVSVTAAANCRWYDLRGQWRRVTALRAAVEKFRPDAVISFIDATNVLALMAFPSGRPPVIACERVNPIYSTIGPHWRLLRRLFYPLAARVVMQTGDTLELAKSLRPRWKAVRIPNPAERPPKRKCARPSFLTLPRNIAAAGRLTRQKGFDLLIRAFAVLAGRFPDWQLTILGEGPERARLEKLAAEHGLSDRVVMPGTLPSLGAVFSNSDLFALSSRFEGFPNVLAEALSWGVPAVSFNCPSGPAEILRDGVDGLLVPQEDPWALAAALGSLMSDEAKRRSMAERAPDVCERFSENSYLDSWEELLKEL